jgi:murein DD-endopeptidase MepM/ murein hydrolase activator NlpD
MLSAWRAPALVFALLLLCGFTALAAVDARPTIRVTVAARSLQPGELVVLTLLPTSEATAVRVQAWGRSIPAFKLDGRHWQALVGIDIDQKPGTSSIVIDARTSTGSVRATEPLKILPKQFPTRVLRVDPDFVNPPGSVQPRIERDALFLRNTYARSAGERLWHGSFVRPVPGEANSRFGTRSIFNGEPRSPHSGADFLSGTGTPIKAPSGGRVVAARDLYFTGNTVIIDHGLGVFSMLAHLSRLDVREGDLVAPGQIVGLVGATGRVTGPHLHWALRVSGARIDPMSALELLSDAESSTGSR